PGGTQRPDFRTGGCRSPTVVEAWTAATWGTQQPMATAVRPNEQLHDTDGFRVESSEGTLGWVEEVWLDDADEPCALAVRTREGRRAVLLRAAANPVQRGQRAVVV